MHRVYVEKKSEQIKANKMEKSKKTNNFLTIFYGKQIKRTLEEQIQVSK